MATKISSIQEFIKSKPTISTDYNSMSFRETHSNISYSICNLITDEYFAELKAMSIDIKLSPDEVMKYRYRPKIMALDLYENAELYYIILRLNDLYNVKDFNLDHGHIRLIPKDRLSESLSEIYNANKQAVDTFNSNHK